MSRADIGTREIKMSHLLETSSLSGQDWLKNFRNKYPEQAKPVHIENIALMINPVGTGTDWSTFRNYNGLDQRGYFLSWFLPKHRGIVTKLGVQNADLKKCKLFNVNACWNSSKRPDDKSGKTVKH